MFITELENLEKEYCLWGNQDINQNIKDIIKIFYDYCIDIDDDLYIALKYMIKYNKRPRYYYDNSFYWFLIEDRQANYYNWLDQRFIFKRIDKFSQLKFIDTYENCLLLLKDNLCS